MAAFASSQHQSGTHRSHSLHPSFLPGGGKFNYFSFLFHSALPSARSCLGTALAALDACDYSSKILIFHSCQIILDSRAISRTAVMLRINFLIFLVPKNPAKCLLTKDFFFFFYFPHYFFSPSLSSPLFYLTACTCFIAQLARPLPIKNISCPVVDSCAFVGTSWSIN